MVDINTFSDWDRSPRRLRALLVWSGFSQV
uniref:Uncharacterized protein n=1 Tax=Anguilla anguilla TaxID=7936 RepID=A0A0E9U014_ANGAN